MFSTWEFKLDDGSKIRAKFTREEIEEMKLKYPEVKFVDQNTDLPSPVDRL